MNEITGEIKDPLIKMAKYSSMSRTITHPINHLLNTIGHSKIRLIRILKIFSLKELS